MRSILITGGAGFIGRHLCRYLCSQGLKVTIFDNFSTSSHDELMQEASCIENLVVFKGDITNAEQLDKAFQSAKPETVVHLAALVSVQESLDHPEKISKVNIQGTMNVLEAARKYFVSKFIFASSAAVYGTLSPPLYEEMAQGSPEQYQKLLSPYAESKLRGEEEVLHSKISSTIFRIFNVYGAGQRKTSGYAAVIPEFIDRIKNHKNIDIFGNGTQTRDFIAVEDVARAVKSAIDKPEIEGIFNLASGRGVSLHELVKVIENHLSRKIDIHYESERMGDIHDSFADIRKLQSHLDFVPKISLEDGIGNLINN